MKKGFIEQILEGKVLIIYDDGSREIIEEGILGPDIKLDLVVEKEGSEYTLKEPDAELAKEIKEVTDEIFKPFDPKNKRKRRWLCFFCTIYLTE